MTKIIGKIKRIDLRSAVIKKLLYENFLEQKFPYDSYRTIEENLWMFYGPDIKVKFSNEVADALIENAGEICEAEIEKGVLVSVKPFKSQNEIIQEFKKKWNIEDESSIDLDLLMTGKPKSLRDKLRIVLAALVEMEKETVMVSESDLLKKLETEFNINYEGAKRLINELVNTGTIYSPKKGYWKIT